MNRSMATRLAVTSLISLLAAAAACPFTSLEAEQINLVDVFVSGADGYHTYRIPSLVTGADGTLLAFCEGRLASASDSGDIDLLLKRSTDDGQTWSRQQVLWDDGPNTCGNPCTVVDQSTGVVWLLMTRNDGGDSEVELNRRTANSTRTVWIMSSRDHGQTWSASTEITPQVKRPEWTWYATGPGAGIQLSHGDHAGRLIIPCDHNLGEGKRYSHVIYSDDHGATWRIGGVTPKDQVNECEVVELTDGRLQLNMRNYDRSRATRQVAYSRDGGLSWQDQTHDGALVEPICQASIRRISWPNGDRPGFIAFSNPDSPDRRENLVLKASFNDGQTWPAKYQLYPGKAAYSCLARLNDGAIGCLFEADGSRRLVFAKLSQEWLAELIAAQANQTCDD